MIYTNYHLIKPNHKTLPIQMESLTEERQASPHILSVTAC